MENITITTLVSITDVEPSTHMDDNADTIAVPPTETVTGVQTLTLPLLNSVDEIDASAIRTYSVDGLPQTFAICAVKGMGIISALGTDPADFAPDNPELIKVTMPELEPGQSIKATVKVNELSDGTRVSWILGDLDDSL